MLSKELRNILKVEELVIIDYFYKFNFILLLIKVKTVKFNEYLTLLTLE